MAHALVYRHSKKCPALYDKARECVCEQHRYLYVLIIALIFAAGEFISGTVLESGAIKGDAWHLFTDAGTDVLALIIATCAIRFTAAEHHWRRWGGYVQAFMLILAGTLILREAYEYKDQHAIKAEWVVIVGFTAVIVGYLRYKAIHPSGEFSKTIRAITHSLMYGKKETTTYIAELIHIITDIGVSVTATIGGIFMLMNNGDSTFDFLASHIMAGLVFIGAVVVVIFAGRHGTHTHNNEKHNH